MRERMMMEQASEQQIPAFIRNLVFSAFFARRSN